MNGEMFQNVFDMIQPFLPECWEKMILYVGYTAGSYSMKYYTSDFEGNYRDCFEQQGVNRAKLIQLFMSIDKVLNAERKKLDSKNRWTVMTMIVGSDGKMKTEFDYTDISEDAIVYERKWEETYVK